MSARPLEYADFHRVLPPLQTPSPRVHPSHDLISVLGNSVGVDLPETIVGHIQLIFVRLLKSIRYVSLPLLVISWVDSSIVQPLRQVHLSIPTHRRSVDPTALVEVLGLDREYQQDASECCGLLFNVILEQLRESSA